MDGKPSYTVVISPQDHLILGGDAICRIIKRNRREIPELVKKEGLKAWRENEKAPWRALCADLLEFNRIEKERNLDGKVV